MIKFRKGEEKDVESIVKIYDGILLNEENGKSHIGWIRGVYPVENTAKDALAAGELFVAEENGKILASARINKTQVCEYKNACWKYKNVPDDKVMVLHTLVVSPFYEGKGIGTKFVKFYEKYAVENNCPYLRMDTNEKNTMARKLYEKLGYSEADIIKCDFNGIKNIRLVCLEKTLAGI